MRSLSVIPAENILAQNITNLRADARGAASLLVQQMQGILALGTAPTNGQTITFDINGTNVVLTAVGTIGTTPGDVLNPGTAAGFVANVLALLNQPQTTTANGVALSAANQLLVGYLSFYLPAGGTSLYLASSNTSLYAPLTSLSVSTTVTSGSWTANTMALYVHKGTVYVNGTRVLFAGGVTPTVTAPSSHPRIDVLTVDNTGTLAWTTGAENASPAVPTYPAGKMPLCELYNVTGETALYDFDNQQSGEGYIQSDVRPILGLQFNPAAIPDTLLPAVASSYDLGSASFPWRYLYGDGSNITNLNTPFTGLSLAVGEAVADRAALAAGWYQSDGGIQTDFATTVTSGFGGTSHTQAVTIGNNANRLLIITVMRNGVGADPTSITVNGVGMTKLVSRSTFTNLGYSIWYLYAPATGSQNIVYNYSSAGYAAQVTSYYGVSQSGFPDNSNTVYGNANSASLSLTPTVAGCVVLAVGQAQGTPSAVSLGSFNTSGSIGDGAVGDSGVINPISAFTATMTFGGTDYYNLDLISFAPATAPTYAIVNANSANPSVTGYYSNSKYRSVAFIGFANGAQSTPGSNTIVASSGILGGFSGLKPLQEYYLNDTNGTIGSTPGTNTRKVGVAIDTTHLAITNIF